MLRRALAIDPSYAPAAALIGWFRFHQRGHGLGIVSDAEAAEALRLAKQALDAGKDDPDALWMAGLTLSHFAGEHPTAAGAVDRALALNPNSAHAWMARGLISVYLGRPATAIEAFQHAMRLSPLDPFARIFSIGTGLAHLMAGRYEEAMEWADRSLREQPDYGVGIRLKVVALAHLGRIGEAREALKRLLELQRGFTIAGYKQFATAVRTPVEFAALYAEGLRKAGLPEE